MSQSLKLIGADTKECLYFTVKVPRETLHRLDEITLILDFNALNVNK